MANPSQDQGLISQSEDSDEFWAEFDQRWDERMTEFHAGVQQIIDTLQRLPIKSSPASQAPQTPPQPISQHKKAQHVTIQEVEHTLSTERMPGKHVVLQRIKSAIKSVPWERLAVMNCWHAVIQWNTMVAKHGMIMVEPNGMPRTGIG